MAALLLAFSSALWSIGQPSSSMWFVFLVWGVKDKLDLAYPFLYGSSQINVISIG